MKYNLRDMTIIKGTDVYSIVQSKPEGGKEISSPVMTMNPLDGNHGVWHFYVTDNGKLVACFERVEFHRSSFVMF